MENSFFEKTHYFNGMLVEIFGLNEAIVLCKIHYCLEANKKANKNFHDERFWIFNSIADWQELHFPFWSIGTIKKVFYKLERSGILIVGNYNKISYDKTKWYSIDYLKLKKIISELL